MAAILCRICFVEPCKLMAKCLEGCCQCFGSCCECFGNCIGACCGAFTRCCDSISLMCDKPFSGCVFVTVLINLVALIYGIVAIIGGGDQCGDPLLIFGIVLLIGTIINMAFSYYMYHSINHDTDNKVFKEENNGNNDQELTTGQKAKALFCEDVKMAIYMLYAVVFMILSVIAMGFASGCPSNIASGVFGVGLITLIYFGVALLIMLSYIAFEVFKEWAGKCECWLIPCCWPCLCIGCCLNWSDDKQSLLDKNNNNNNGRSNQYVAPPEQTQTVGQQATYTTQQPVVVVQQPVTIQQQQPQPVVYVQQPPQQQQPMVTQPVAAQPTYQQQPAYNPQAAPIQPGVLVVNQPAPSTNTNYSMQQTQQQQQVVAEENVDEKNEIDYDELKQKGKEVAVAAGQQAKKAGVAALGWMAKKMNDLNDKVQEKEKGKEAAEGQEGGEGNGNQNTY